ncbi:MAG: phosphatidate cytidylyltransferase [Oscillospiraceae bacterium]|nr:phosphatidate cytidylyltransferase [Oscillospiraceae bacterium]
MKTRILAAVGLLIPLVILVTALPKILSAVVCGLAAAIGAWELLHQTGYVKHPRLVLYAALSGFAMCMWSYAGQRQAWLTLLVLAVFSVYFAEMMASHVKLTFEKIAICLVAALVIPYLLSSLIRIHGLRLGRYYIFVPFIMAFLPDSGAYFAGKFFGRHKLAPVISPKKTIEGVVGGTVSGVLGMLLYALLLDLAFGMDVNYLYAGIYGIGAAVGSVMGDLSFSVIKRQTGIKDYGNLIPGHGGVLDRLDSMMVVGPLAEVLLLLLPLAVK